MSSPRLREQGSALVIAILFLLVLSILVTLLHQTTITEVLYSRTYQDSQKAFYAAETGISAGLQWLANVGSPPEDSFGVDPWFSPTTLATPAWSPEFTDSNNQCTYRYFVEHLKNEPTAESGGESAKIGTSASAGSMMHYYRITAEGISRDRLVRRQVQLVTTALY